MTRALEALENAMASRTCVKQLADAISHTELFISNMSLPNSALLDSLELAKVRLADAHTEQRAAQREAAPDTAEHEFVALALSQPVVKNHIVIPTRRQQEQDDSMLCMVCCISNPKRVLLLPCQHMCVCSGCCESILQVEPLCPLCRAHIETRIEVFA